MKISLFRVVSLGVMVFLFFQGQAYAQSDNFTPEESKNLETVKNLASFFKDKNYDTLDRNQVFSQYVSFDNYLIGVSKEQSIGRIKAFDKLFGAMIHFADSVGFENFGFKPTRYFRSNKEYFAPFLPGRSLNDELPYTLTYFLKEQPEKPLGALLFDPDNNKLVS